MCEKKIKKANWTKSQTQAKQNKNKHKPHEPQAKTL